VQFRAGTLTMRKKIKKPKFSVKVLDSDGVRKSAIRVK
jgi:hypothetical protein